MEKSQEIKRHFKVRQNLKILNKHVKHIRTQSAGNNYSRQKYNKIYKGLVNSKTPKNRDFRGFDFSQLFHKDQNPRSHNRLRNSDQLNIIKAMTHLSNNALNKSQKSESNIFDSA